MVMIQFCGVSLDSVAWQLETFTIKWVKYLVTYLFVSVYASIFCFNIRKYIV